MREGEGEGGGGGGERGVGRRGMNGWTVGGRAASGACVTAVAYLVDRIPGVLGWGSEDIHDTPRGHFAVRKEERDASRCIDSL